jgi:hypothetical protein
VLDPYNVSMACRESLAFLSARFTGCVEQRQRQLRSSDWPLESIEISTVRGVGLPLTRLPPARKALVSNSTVVS